MSSLKRWAAIVLSVNFLAFLGSRASGISFQEATIEVLLWMNLVFVLEIYGGIDK